MFALLDAQAEDPVEGASFIPFQKDCDRFSNGGQTG